MDNNLILIGIILFGLLIAGYGYFQFRIKLNKDDLKTYIKKYTGLANVILGLIVCCIGIVEYFNIVVVKYVNIILVRYILIIALILSLLLRFWLIYIAYKKYNNRNKVTD